MSPSQASKILQALVFLATACGGGGGSDAPPPQGQPESGDAPPPNIVLIVADDLGYGDVGCYGSPTIATPQLDSLSDEGIRFTSFYAHGVCTPSRAALLTGRYGLRVGLSQALGPWSHRGLHPDETTLPEVLRPLGYRTALFGKWHLGDSPDQQPTSQGFDEFSGLLWGPGGIPTVELDTPSGAREFDPDPVTQTSRATDRALDFIARGSAANQPFLCVVSYVAPHKPAVASPAYVGSSVDDRDYGDAVEEMDAAVGRIVDSIDDLGLGDKTLVLFVSDNGASTQGDPYQNGSNGVLSGGKGTSWEGGVRVPAIARWSGTIEAGRTVDEPVALTDLLPSLAELAGATLNPAIPIDGVDVSEVLLDPSAALPLRPIAISAEGVFEAVRRGPYKYRLGQLFDVDSDPGETMDIAAVLPALTQELADVLSSIALDVETNGRAPGATLRKKRQWRAGERHDDAPVDGDVWRTVSQDFELLRLEDKDSALDMLAVETVGRAPQDAPLLAMRVDDYSKDLRWIWDTADLRDGDPFTVEFWFRALASERDRDIALLDVGDRNAGLSVTVGDAGILGDDTAPGRRDDVRVRIGGVASFTSATVEFDLDGDASERFQRIAIVHDEAGELRVYVDGFLRGQAQCPGASWAPSDPWSLFAPKGELGGAGGPGAQPFDAAHSRGEIAGLDAWDRALRVNELQFSYCRYLYVPFCFGTLHSGGENARLGLTGSFLPAEKRCLASVTNGPSGAIGRLLVSPLQTRIDIGAGTLCLGEPRLELTATPVQLDATGSASFALLPEVPLPGFDPSNGQSWNFQFVFQDGATMNTTNAVRVIFCR